jgi:hypothetical protein
VRRAFGWVHRAAEILADDEAGGPAVRRRLRGLVAAMTRHARVAGRLMPAIAHFLKVTRSYWPGLFACYDVAELPRTNNDLEQFFGSHRHHERRCSGRRAACAGTVVRGSVRLAASAATRLGAVTAEELVPADPDAWKALRAGLATRAAVRVLGRRFRRDPAAYLASLAPAHHLAWDCATGNGQAALGVTPRTSMRWSPPTPALSRSPWPVPTRRSPISSPPPSAHRSRTPRSIWSPSRSPCTGWTSTASMPR